jgi:hypothetical protein
VDEALAQFTEQQDAAGIRGAKVKRVAVPSNLGSMDALYQEYSALMTPAEPCRSPEALAEEFKRRGHQDPKAEGDQFLEEIFGDDWAACKVQQKAAGTKQRRARSSAFDRGYDWETCDVCKGDVPPLSRWGAEGEVESGQCPGHRREDGMCGAFGPREAYEGAERNAVVEPEVKTAGFDTPESIVEELILWINNTEPLYRQKLLCYKNLVGKVDRKIYDPAKAVKLMLYCVDAAAQSYMKEFGAPEDHQGGATWHDIFPRDVRIEAAKELVREFVQDMKSGEQYLQDFHAKKYQPKPEVKPEPKTAAVAKQAGGKAMLDDLELWSWIDSETPEFGQFLMRLLASVPGGDEAEGMGYEPFTFLGWQEWSMVAEMMQVVEGAQDVEYLVQKLMGPDPDGRDAEIPEVPAEDLAEKFR